MESNKTIRIFDGATAIVTGAASGIGRALAEELAKRGCEVVLADLQIELAEEVASAIRAAGGKARAFILDVADFSAVESLLRDTVQRTGRLDYMFNNAGIGFLGHFSLHSIEDWDRIIDVNLRGVVNGVQVAYQIMLSQGFGHIVNTASIGGLIPTANEVPYATTKHAVVGLSNSLRAEAASAGIQVSVLCPGIIRTPILGGGKYGKILADISPKQLSDFFEKFKPMSPNLFAEKVLKSVAKNKAIIIVPSWWKLFWWINRLSPSLGIFLAQKHFQYRQKKLGILLSERGDR
jgi:NAD(P)-dependent dehydrogenase (short-subunit alcohol dehydrogenase family)